MLRGGDHGAKVAAERRFRQKDGPRVLVCTAAGREGINLQFARILFNFDLPWNPMDMEQRIGRIHRYGQNHTAQVYNLVLSDTIEGRIFLLLDEKLTEIARTVGKVDEQGNVAEDLRAQILGQLSERLNYDRLYQEALSDPELKRTQVELEADRIRAPGGRSLRQGLALRAGWRCRALAAAWPATGRAAPCARVRRSRGANPASTSSCRRRPWPAAGNSQPFRAFVLRTPDDLPPTGYSQNQSRKGLCIKIVSSRWDSSRAMPKALISSTHATHVFDRLRRQLRPGEPARRRSVRAIPRSSRRSARPAPAPPGWPAVGTHY